MELTPFVFAIVCPMLFLAGLVDAIGGGAGDSCGRENVIVLFP